MICPNHCQAVKENESKKGKAKVVVTPVKKKEIKKKK